MSQQKSAGFSKVYFPALFLADIGLLVSAYLTFIHYKVFTDPNYNIMACKIGEKFNCRAVAMSSYAIFLEVPTAFWGVLFYLGISTVLLLLMLKKGEKGEPSPLFGVFALMSAFGFVMSMGMAYVSHALLKVLCLWCMILYVVSIALLISVFVISKVEGVPILPSVKKMVEATAKYFYIPLVAAGLVVVTSAVYPKYWRQSEELKKKVSNLNRGEEDGAYWLGASNPKATLVMFSDYECPYCKRAHAFIKEYLAQYGDKLRLIHRHFPMDNACNPLIKRKFHEYACFLAAIAVCAGEQGKFWEAGDFLYSQNYREGIKKEVFLERTAKALKLDYEKLRMCTLKSETTEKIRRDIELGLKKYKIRGTPFFVLNGQPYRRGFDKTIREKLNSLLKGK